jgi:hypothetical protein
MTLSNKAAATLLVASERGGTFEGNLAFKAGKVRGDILAMLARAGLTSRVDGRHYATEAGLAMLVELGMLSSEGAMRRGEALDEVRAQRAVRVAEAERVAMWCQKLGVRPRSTVDELKADLAASVKTAEASAMQAQRQLDEARARQAKALALMGEP